MYVCVHECECAQLIYYYEAACKSGSTDDAREKSGSMCCPHVSIASPHRVIDTDYYLYYY